VTRILIVEDNPDLAAGLRANLEVEGYEVEIARDGRSGLERSRETGPDLVILDLMLPFLDGYRVLERMREDGLDAPVLILTAREEEADKVLGFRLGADDYVTKPFGLLELLARVEALLRRGRAGSRDRIGRLRSGDLVVDLPSRTVRLVDQPVSLAPKEFDLLVALMLRTGAAASRIELMEEVWGYPGAVVSRTVDTHVAEVRRKLGDDPEKPRFIATVRSVGYRFVGRVDSASGLRGDGGR